MTAPGGARRRSTAAHQAILTATLELVEQHGFPALTIEAIAARAGVGKQTIYRWWPSKAAVLFDAMLAGDPSPGASGSRDHRPAMPDTGDIAADLRDLLRATVAEYADPRVDRLQRGLTAQVLQDPAMAATMRERLLGPQTAAVVARLRSAQSQGQLDPRASPELLAELLFGPVLHRWALGTGELNESFADRIVDLVIRAAQP